MQALIKISKEPGLCWGEVAEPSLGSHDVKILIKKTAICGTDLHIYRSDPWPLSAMSLPMHIGHEYVGEVVEVGNEVTAIKMGDRVSGEGHVTCGHCRNCRAGQYHLCPQTASVGVTRAGAFTKYLVIPEDNVYVLPEFVSDDYAAILDPLGNAVHTALSFDLVGEDVLITGAGPTGLMAAAIAKKVGARFVVITDINETRLNIARELGVTEAVNPTKTPLVEIIKKVGMCEGFDVGLEMSGNGIAMRDMLTVMRHGGKIALLGIASKEYAVDWNQIVLKGLTLKGIYGREMYETWYKMISLIQSGLNLDPIITHRLDVEHYEQGFNHMLSGNCGKVILDWRNKNAIV